MCVCVCVCVCADMWAVSEDMISIPSGLASVTFTSVSESSFMTASTSSPCRNSLTMLPVRVRSRRERRRRGGEEVGREGGGENERGRREGRRMRRATGKERE